VSALGCFYLRLIGKPEDIYSYLEPLYNDYRKLRYRETDGKYKLIHVDEFVEDLLTVEAICDTILPRLAKRQILEDNGSLQQRHSVLEDLEEDDETLLAEIKENGENELPKGIMAGDDELIENPRAAALKPDRRSSEEKSPRRKHRDEDDEERRRKKEKKRHKKEKKKKYRTRGSVSRSRSRSRDDSDRSSKSRSRSRSRSERKKKKSSKWKKNLKEKRRDRSRDRSGSRDRRSKSRDRRDKDSGKGPKNGEDAKVDENSDEYWLSMRAKLGLKPV